MLINVPILTERSGAICENRVRTHLDRGRLSSWCSRRSPGTFCNAASDNGPVSWNQSSAGPLTEAGRSNLLESLPDRHGPSPCGLLKEAAPAPPPGLSAGVSRLLGAKPSVP